MELKLNNVARIKNANVKINGLTIVAGENSTGKSTVGKTLFSCYASLYDLSNQIRKEKIEILVKSISRFQILNNIDIYNSGFDVYAFSSEIVDLQREFMSSELDLKQYLIEHINGYGSVSSDYIVDDLIMTINNLFNVKEDEIISSIVYDVLSKEFNGNINNVYEREDAEIELKIKNEKINITLIDNNYISCSNTFSLYNEAIYLSNPFVIDYNIRENPLRSAFRDEVVLPYHDVKLIEMLQRSSMDNALLERILTSKQLDSIMSKLKKVFGADIVYNDDYESSGLEVRRYGEEATIQLSAISAGLKPFAIIKMLLMNGALKDNGILILDEPEIHLHPKWQILFAEIIVLLQKEFGMHIIINTHSPYFLSAIEVFVDKYKIQDSTNYYLSKNISKNWSEIIDVTNDLEPVYAVLAEPFQYIENLRWANDLGN